MIYIDFQGGAHGNYLEFVCNKFLAGTQTASSAPFNVHGASHNKKYVTPPLFKADHYFDSRRGRTVPETGDIISIQITEDDILPLTAISLLRAGDYGYENDLLEVDTYNKLNNPDYIKSLQVIIDSFFKTQVKDSYDAVKDPQWPEINTLKEFNNLPQWIQDECKDVHNLCLLEFSAESPNCPRWILREFFKIGFSNPGNSGFIVAQRTKMYYNNKNRVINFPFSSFYSTEHFAQELTKIAEWAGLSFAPSAEFVSLHTEFLQKQPYAKSKQVADQLVNRIVSGEEFFLPHLDLLTESYICAKLEKHYNREWKTSANSWFPTSTEIRNYILS